MSTILIFSENNNFESYISSQTTKTNKINNHHHHHYHHKNNKDKPLSLKKTSKKINKRTSSPPIFIPEQPLQQQQQNNNSNNYNQSPSPQFYFYNHSDQLSTPTSPTFQSTVKSPTKRKRVYKHHQEQRRYSCPSFNIENSHDNKNLNELEDEFAYTQETLATVNIMFDSLKQTFIDYEPHLKPNVTRLCEKEKELLSAYDDLELQVIHLKRHINKLESSWQQWKSTCNNTNNNNNNSNNNNSHQLLPSPSNSTSSLS